MKLARSNAVSNTGTMKSEKRFLVCSRDISFLYILKCLLQSSYVVVYICHFLQKCTTALKSPSDVEVSDSMRYAQTRRYPTFSIPAQLQESNFEATAQTRNRTSKSLRKPVFETGAMPLCDLGLEEKRSFYFLSLFMKRE